MIHEPPQLAPPKLKGEVIKVYNAYARLSTADRRKVDQLLLSHAFTPKGTNAYLSVKDCSEVHRQFRYEQFVAISQAMADAWLCWAREIAAIRPSRLVCQKAILRLLSALFS